MKVFFDEDAPRKLARSLPQHEIHTVVSMQWGGIKNGALLQLIEREGFNVSLTGDKNMENQQRLEGRRLIAACSLHVDQARAASCGLRALPCSHIYIPNRVHI